MRCFVAAVFALSFGLVAAPVCAQGVFDIGVLTDTVPSTDQSQEQHAKGGIARDIGGKLLAPKAFVCHLRRCGVSGACPSLPTRT